MNRNLAKKAVAKSQVLLKNQNATIPLSKSCPLIFVAGKWTDDIGLQCGCWTIVWLGKLGDITTGTTILEAIRATFSPDTVVVYDQSGDLSHMENEDGQETNADVGLLVLGEMPYAEGFGDRADLTLSEGDITLIERMRERCKKLVIILVSSRPLILTDQLPLLDALIATWLPGSEGQGVVDALLR